MTSPLDVVAGFGKMRVLVVGDVMLDRFVYARVSRISPEAPVPVLAVEREVASWVAPAMSRAMVLASLAVVDLVVIFGEDTPEALIKELRPDLLVKGADYKRQEVVGADFVSSYGGEVMLAEPVPDRSTSSLIGRARE